ncbi:MAG TPA: SulP family inorganic anion transporter [Candidatus Dormibacteraeota bacterium]|jgi:SulP family sulfate permease|nr:SulP family inorganic anion transporter [Candidatus Dormibacteraeota bacterium]
MNATLDAWLPKSVILLRNYDRHKFQSDLIAGVTVGLVALPLAMAFAISSGLSPQAGLYCAIVTGFLISALGGSKTQIGGPTGAFVVVVAGIIAKYGVGGLFVCTMMAGVLLLLLGITGMGTAVKYFPRPVVVGFTNGIAILIASTQIRDFFGLQLDSVPGDFFHRMTALGRAFPTLNWRATLLAALSLAIMIFCLKFARKIPGAIVVCFGATAAVAVLHLPVETIGSRFGGIPSGLPHIAIPALHYDTMRQLFSAAFTVAMLGAIESLMSAVVSDKMSGDKHNPNVELMAQGVANIFSPLFGGLPATGAIARTATNVRSGAKTPVAGMIHALTLLVIILFAAPLVKNVPLSALAAILMMVAYNMGDWEEIPEILKLSAADIAVWLLTLTLTVVTDLTFAVEIGMVLAALTFIRKVSRTTTVTRVTRDYVEDSRVHILQGKDIPSYAAVFRVHGPFLFGTTDKFEEILRGMNSLPPIVILRLRNMTAIDATGLGAIRELADEVHSTGRTLVLCGAREQPSQLMQQAEFERHVGKENIVASITDAIRRSNDLYTSQYAQDSRWRTA